MGYAIFQMKNNKALDPNIMDFFMSFISLLLECYTNDNTILSKDFHNGTLPFHSLNYEVVIFVSKRKEAILWMLVLSFY